MKLPWSRRWQSLSPQSKSPKPHMWVWCDDEVMGGVVRFLLREGDLIETMTVRQRGELERAFSDISEVFRIHIYSTYVVVQWSRGSYEDIVQSVVAVGLTHLARYCNWQGELLTPRIGSLEAMQELRRREGLTDRWHMGTR